jgi:hypothetical protein
MHLLEKESYEENVSLDRVSSLDPNQQNKLSIILFGLRLVDVYSSYIGRSEPAEIVSRSTVLNISKDIVGLC